MLKDSGRANSNIVELVDIFPTFADYAGLPPVPGQTGRTLLPALANPLAKWDRNAYTMVMRPQGKIGYAIHTARFRYIQWDEGRAGVELYDHHSDPNEFLNLADDPGYASHRQALAKALARFRQSL